MFVLSGPYNSSFLGKSLRNLNECVLAIDNTHIPFKNSYSINNISDYEIDGINISTKILTSLEDALPFLYKHYEHNDSIKAAQIFKNKNLFKKLFDSNPKFDYALLNSVLISEPVIYKFPVNKIAKPNSGISSLGIVKLNKLTNPVIIPASKEKPYLIEDIFEGKEYAVDGYYDEYGTPIILNIMHHLFSSIDETDISDTLYYTNMDILNQQTLNARKMLNDIRDSMFDIHKIQLKNFPFHFEYRVNELGVQHPIELNPLRFSGYGTCEIAHYAYNINPYKCYFKSINPKWSEKRNHMKHDYKSYYGFYFGKNLNIKNVSKTFEEILEIRLIPNSEDYIIFFRETNKDRLQVLADTKGII